MIASRPLMWWYTDDALVPSCAARSDILSRPCPSITVRAASRIVSTSSKRFRRWTMCPTSVHRRKPTSIR